MSHPWFPFYAGDWLSSARRAQLTLAEQGLYILMLAWDWTGGGLSDDVAELLRVLPREATQEAVEKLRGLFFERSDDHRWRNPKLADLRAKADDKSEKARLSARARWDANAQPEHMRTQSDRISPRNANQKPEPDVRGEKPEPDQGFSQPTTGNSQPQPPARGPKQRDVLTALLVSLKVNAQQQQEIFNAPLEFRVLFGILEQAYERKGIKKRAAWALRAVRNEVKRKAGRAP